MQKQILKKRLELEREEILFDAYFEKKPVKERYLRKKEHKLSINNYYSKFNIFFSSGGIL